MLKVPEHAVPLPIASKAYGIGFPASPSTKRQRATLREEYPDTKRTPAMCGGATSGCCLETLDPPILLIILICLFVCGKN